MSEVWCYAMQPSVFPTILQMERVVRSHVVILLDDVQLDRAHTNTLLIGKGGPVRVPLDLNGRRRGTFAEQVLQAPGRQRDKLIRTLQMVYGKQEKFSPVSAKILTDCLADGDFPLSGVGWRVLITLQGLLRLEDRHILIASEVAPNRPEGCEGIMELCRKVGATDYYQGTAGLEAYFDRGAVTRAGLRVWGQEYSVPRYRQTAHELSLASIVDPIMVGGVEMARLAIAANAGKGRRKDSMRRWA